MPKDEAAGLPRVLGVGDLILFTLVVTVSLRWVAGAAAAGPSAITVWGLALAGFYLPLASAVIVLSARYPQEGGLYVWTREAFGPFAGFIAGWCYFFSNLPYFPSVFYFAAGNALFIGPPRWQALAADPAYFMGFALVVLAAITLINLFGLKFGKWLSNLGAIGVWLPALAVSAMGALAWARFGAATRFSAAAMAPRWDLAHLTFFATIAFAFVGAEVASFAGDEIKDTARTIRRALPIAGVAIAACYIITTVAVLVAMPAGAVNPLQGLIQAIAATAQRLGAGWIVAPLALLITLGIIGAASSYLTAVARIPFAIGIDHLLPAAFARVHPRWGTPWVALLVEGALGAACCILGQAGTGVRGAYAALVAMSIIANFIPFLLMFGAVLRLPGGGRGAKLLALVGLMTTALALVLAVVPDPGEASPALAITKVVGMCAVMLGAGAAIFALGRRRAER